MNPAILGPANPNLANLNLARMHVGGCQSLAELSLWARALQEVRVPIFIYEPARSGMQACRQGQNTGGQGSEKFFNQPTPDAFWAINAVFWACAWKKALLKRYGPKFFLGLKFF